MLRPNPLRAEFAKFFEEPTLPGLRDLLRRNVGELIILILNSNGQSTGTYQSTLSVWQTLVGAALL
jgi:hypothetical protein